MSNPGGLHLRCRGVLLRDQQAANLQELIGLLAGELVSVADGLHLTRCPLGGRLQTLQGFCIAFQVPLLQLQPFEKRIVGLLLRFAGELPNAVMAAHSAAEQPAAEKHGEDL